VRYGVCFEGGLKAADTRHRRLRCDDNYCEYSKAMIRASFENFNAWRAIIRTGPKLWHDIQAALSEHTFELGGIGTRRIYLAAR
jgi:hypothetical protein